MDNKVVITGEFKGSKQNFRSIKKSKIDCFGSIFKTFKIKFDSKDKKRTSEFK